MAEDSLPSGRVIVVGLGNPGPKYDGTRHNIGFDVVKEFARRNQLSLSENRFDAELGTGVVEQRPIVAMLPQTYMNRSGFSVARAANFWKLNVDSIIVLHDDIDLEAGRVRLKRGGGHGGHNGLRSLDQQLGDKRYFRVRLGVGRPLAAGDVTGWVLGHFGKAENDSYEDLLWNGAEAVERLLRDGLSASQNEIHARGG